MAAWGGSAGNPGHLPVQARRASCAQPELSHRPSFKTGAKEEASTRVWHG